jgi:hypothetical protein
MREREATLLLKSRTLSPGLITACILLFAGTPVARADDWLPVSPEELKMTSEPLAPSASAIILYRQVDRDDNGPHEIIYDRIKILSEEGRKYGDVEIPFYKESESVTLIAARTIDPDGNIVNFNGTVYEKPLVEAHSVKLLAKSFTMPNVRVGSIIEYRYKHQLGYGWVFNSHWILSQELFTKYAKFSLSPNRTFSIAYSWPNGLPDNTASPALEHGSIRLESRDVPAFVTEDYMPPENDLKYRVDFIYQSERDLKPGKDANEFWKKYGKREFSVVDDFIDKRRAMQKVAAQIIVPGDDDEAKLRKIYARVQKVRNLSFEKDKTAQEEQRDKTKMNKNADDVWSRGYGTGNQLDLLFLALARALDIPSDLIVVSDRHSHFFNARTMNPSQLNSYVVVATLGGKSVYLDPGIPCAPFGMLPWAETAVPGLRLDKNGGTWVDTPLPEPKESRVERSAHFKLTSAGLLEGKVTVTYTGQEALWRRQEEMNEDDADKKQSLETQLKADIASEAEVELSNRPDWDSTAPLVAEFDVKLGAWATAAGQRTLFPIGLFGARDKKIFTHATRIHPVYYHFPYQSSDIIFVDLPDSWKIASLPKPRSKNQKSLTYSESAEDKDGALLLRRDLSVYLTVVATKFYGQIQAFYEAVRNGDEDQAILAADKKAAAR